MEFSSILRSEGHVMVRWMRLSELVPTRHHMTFRSKYCVWYMSKHPEKSTFSSQKLRLKLDYRTFFCWRDVCRKIRNLITSHGRNDIKMVSMCRAGPAGHIDTSFMSIRSREVIKFPEKLCRVNNKNSVS